jgi:hypothetical protein
MWTEIKRNVTSTSSPPSMPELRDAHCRSFVICALVEFVLLSPRLKKMRVYSTKCNLLIITISVAVYTTLLYFSPNPLYQDWFIFGIFFNKFWTEKHKEFCISDNKMFFVHQDVTYRCLILGPATFGQHLVLEISAAERTWNCKENVILSQT